MEGGSRGVAIEGTTCPRNVIYLISILNLYVGLLNANFCVSRESLIAINDNNDIMHETLVR